jgi:hypothetical protein
MYKQLNVAGNRLQAFFGDDIEETWDSLRSVPGAFGNIIVAVMRQLRPVDVIAFAVVAAGLGWLVIGHIVLGERHLGLFLLSLLPLLLWLVAGLVGGLVFHIGAIGRGAFAYWESYVLVLFFAVFGVISLRLALDPRDRRVYRATPPTTEA